jgi:hypothetical protein
MLLNRCPIPAFALGVLFAIVSTDINSYGQSSVASTSPSIPPGTAIPVRFARTIDVNKVRAGDQVVAKTMQVVVLANGEHLAKGATVKGHVVEVRPYNSGSGTDPESKASLLSIHFDQIESASGTIPASLNVRALADSLESKAAYIPNGIDETDHQGNLALIGGGQYSPLDKMIRDNHDEVIGHIRRDGIFADLLASKDMTSGSNYRCEGTTTEQSIAIFAPNACGLYGFGNQLSMTREGSGSFTLKSARHSIKLHAGTTALLQETGMQSGRQPA